MNFFCIHHSNYKYTYIAINSLIVQAGVEVKKKKKKKKKQSSHHAAGIHSLLNTLNLLKAYL